MGTIIYKYTITDAKWFDAIPCMGNFNQVKSEINGQLNEDNFDDTMTPTVATVQVSEEISGSLIEPTGNLSIKASTNKDILFRLESDPLNVKYLRVDETGVLIGA